MRRKHRVWWLVTAHLCRVLRGKSAHKSKKYQDWDETEAAGWRMNVTPNIKDISIMKNERKDQHGVAMASKAKYHEMAQ